MRHSDPVRDWRAELARWAAAPPQRSAEAARARLVAALDACAVSPRPRRLLAVGVAVIAACLVVLLGRGVVEVASHAPETPSVSRATGARAERPPAPAPREVIVHTLSSGTRLYFTLPTR